MAKHRAVRAARRWLPAVALLAVVVAVVVVAALLRTGDPETGVTGAAPSPAACTTVRVVAAGSFAPALDAVAPGLRQGPGCVTVDLTRGDGRAAASVAAEKQADVWIPDDTAWAAGAGSLKLAESATGAGTVLAASPVCLVADAATGERLRAAGGSWAALAKLVDDGNARLVVRDPAGSGDGLIGAGAVAEAVWLGQDMDASALWLARAQSRTRTVTGSAPAWPAAPGEVGLVPEYAMLGDASADPGLSVSTGTDFTALLRYTWFPTATGVADPARAAALERLRSALSGPGAAPARAAAHLRDADAAVAPATTGGGASAPPGAPAGPLDVLGAHHVDHVFATWYPPDRRADVLLVVDVSGSMADPARGSGTPLIDLVRQGVRSAGRLLPDDARLGLWEFGVRLDGDRDHRELLDEQPLNDGHRAALATAADRLAARRTGTGLHDTILAAYTGARDNYRPGVLNQVLVFTDGRNQDDPGGLSAGVLADRLRDARDPDRPVQLSVVTFGDPATAKIVGAAVKPVDGYVDAISTPDEVSAVFIHVAAGGLHH